MQLVIRIIKLLMHYNYFNVRHANKAMQYIINLYIHKESNEHMFMFYISRFIFTYIIVDPASQSRGNYLPANMETCMHIRDNNFCHPILAEICHPYKFR